MKETREGGEKAGKGETRERVGLRGPHPPPRPFPALGASQVQSPKQPHTAAIKVSQGGRCVLFEAAPRREPVPSFDSARCSALCTSQFFRTNAFEEKN